MAAIAVLFLPNIVCSTPLKDWLVAKATHSIPAKIQVGKISAGWLQPVVISNISIADEESQEIVSIDS
ncbi:MAG: hypothetical protein AAGA30_01420, partial [Planctomycetota bacterium]